MDNTSSAMLTTTEGYFDNLSVGGCENCSSQEWDYGNNDFVITVRDVSFIVCCTICTLGLLCNGFIIIILFYFPNMKTLPNTFIMNLAMADFLFMISLFFLSHQLKNSEWVFGAFMCRLIIPYDAMAQFLVIFFVMIMSIDRYLAICLPIKSMNFRTLRNGRIVSGLTWLMAILTTLPLWIFSEHSCSEVGCLCLAHVSWGDESDTRWWIIYTIIIGFCVPLTIVCVCYLLILQNLLTNTMQDSKNTLRRAARRVAILVICVIIVFILCFLPFYVFQLVYSTLEPDQTNNASILIYIITWTLMYSHSIINPIVYTLVGENFRKNIAFVFCKRTRNVLYSRQSSMRTSSFHIRRTRNSLKSCNSNDPASVRPHNGYYVHLDTGQRRGAREDPV